MSKGKGLTFTVFAILGALTGYATYMARKNEFSNETVDKYGAMLNKAKHVGVDLKRAYTSIGDEKGFIENTNNLKKNAQKLAENAGSLVKSATNDMYKYAKSNVEKSLKSIKKESKSTKKATAKKSTKKK